MRNAAEANSGSDFGRHLGERLTILFKIDDDPSYPFSEVVGTLESYDKAVLSVRKRSGDLVLVPETSIIRLKFIAKANDPKTEIRPNS